MGKKRILFALVYESQNLQIYVTKKGVTYKAKNTVQYLRYSPIFISAPFVEFNKGYLGSQVVLLFWMSETKCLWIPWFLYHFESKAGSLIQLHAEYTSQTPTTLLKTHNTHTTMDDWSINYTLLRELVKMYKCAHQLSGDQHNPTSWNWLFSPAQLKGTVSWV